jgi:hypothetical protein
VINRSLQGLVNTTFANPSYIEKNIRIPTSANHLIDRTFGVQLLHSSQGFHGYHSYFTTWSDLAVNGSASTLQELRPRPLLQVMVFGSLTGSFPRRVLFVEE